MLIFTEPINVQPIVQMYNFTQFEVLNLSSLSQVPPQKQLELMPTKMLSQIHDEKAWDMAYAQWIFEHDDQFISLMKIVYPLYMGINVIVMVNWFHDIGSYYMENINESIMKLIQQRYGYSSYIINSPDDLTIDITQMESSFTIPGLYCLDQDKDRMSFILQSRIDSNEISEKDWVTGYVDATIQGD